MLSSSFSFGLALIRTAKLSNYILPLEEENTRDSLTLDRLFNHICKVTYLPQMLVIKLEPSIKALTIEISPVVPPVIANHSSENKVCRQIMSFSHFH